MKPGQNKIFTNFILLFTSLLLTSATLVMGTAPIRILRIRLGSASFWIMSLVVSAALLLANLKFLGFSFLGLSILVGLYADFEEKDFGFQKSAALAVTSATAYLATIVTVWGSFQQSGWLLLIKEKIQTILNQSQFFKEADSTKLVSEVFVQLPSAAVMALIVGLILSLILEKPMLRLMKMKSIKKVDLASFKVPEMLIWFLIATLLGSFYLVDEASGLSFIKPLSANVLNILMLLYFLQGMAIVNRFFVGFKISSFWRAIWTFIIVTQLFIVVSVLGVMDYWFNFRSIISKRVKLLNKNSNNI